MRVNQHAAQRYRAMADAAEGLGVDAEYLTGRCKFVCETGVNMMELMFVDAEVEKYINQVDDLDTRVEELEKVVRELDEWTGELGKIKQLLRVDVMES